MEAIQTQRLRTAVRARRFMNMLLLAGGLGIVAFTAKEAMKPWGRMEAAGLKASCEGPLKACHALVKGGDVVQGVRIAGGEFVSLIRVAGLDGRGVVFSRYVSGVSGQSLDFFRVNYDGSKANCPETLDGIKVERTPDPTRARVFFH
jgi:hypothetical protein